MRKLLIFSVVAATVATSSIAPAEARKKHVYDRGTYHHDYRCRKHGGTTGAIVGGVAGGLLGHAVLGGTGGALVGAGGGALGGRAIERSSNKRNCR